MNTTITPLVWLCNPRYELALHDTLKIIIQNSFFLFYFRPKMAILGSREQMCIHDDVRLLRGKAQNHACQYMCKKRKCRHHPPVSGTSSKYTHFLGNFILHFLTLKFHMQLFKQQISNMLLKNLKVPYPFNQKYVISPWDISLTLHITILSYYLSNLKTALIFLSKHKCARRSNAGVLSFYKQGNFFLLEYMGLFQVLEGTYEKFLYYSP